MKNLFLIIIACCLFTITAYSQAPQNFNYQAVVRDASGQPVTNSQVSFRLSILENGPSGATLFQEVHRPQSSDMGVVALQIGNGTNMVGSFSNVNWSNGDFWLQVEMDISGGNNYQIMSSNQLVSVPFAMHAATVDDKDDADADPTNEFQNLAFDPNTNELSISNGNIVTIPTGGTDADADPSNELQALSKMGNLITLSRNGGTVSVDDGDADAGNEIQFLNRNGSLITLSKNGGAFTDETEDADADPQNEIQSLAFNPNTNELRISGSNSVTIPTGGTDADADPTNEIQMLTRNANVITLSKSGGSFVDEVEDADPDPTNEMQTISKSGNRVSLSGNGGSFIDEVNDADADPVNEIQVLSRNGNQISLSNNGGTFVDEVDDADADPSNELQDLQLTGTELTISNGNSVDLNQVIPQVTDDQNLQLNGNTLSIEDGNSVDLSGYETPWQPDPVNPNSTIQYTGGNAMVKDEISGENVNIFPYSVSVANGSGRTGFLNPSAAKFQSTDFQHVVDYGYFGAHFFNPGFPSVETLSKLDKDSLYFYEPGGGLILPTMASMKPWGVNFSNSVDKASYNYWGLNMETADMAMDISPYAVEGIQKNQGGSLFTRFYLGKDSLTLWNDAKWKNAWLGTTENGSGGLTLSSGSNANKLVEITGVPGTDLLNPNPLPGGNLYLYDYQENLRLEARSNEEAGWMSMISDTLASITSPDGITAGVKSVFGSGSDFFLQPRAIVGVETDTKQGYFDIADASGDFKAGMHFKNGNARVYSKGRFSILDATGKERSVSDQYGYSLLDENGIEAVSITNDIIDPGIGYISTNGANGFLNVEIGANTLDGYVDGGAVTIFGSSANAVAGMKVSDLGNGTVWSNWEMAIEDDLGRYASVNTFAVDLLNPSQGGFSVSMYRDIFENNGIFQAYDGTGSLNFMAGPNPDPNSLDGTGYAAVYDNAGVAQAGFYIDNNGNGVVFADLKPFRMDHPEDADKEIWYVAMEGPEAGAYTRGTATLENGEAFVPFPEHFSLLATPETMTVILTPLSIDTYGLAVVEKTDKGIRVKELKGGSGNFEFDWEVKCVRKGQENFEVIRKKQTKAEMHVPAREVNVSQN